VHDTQRRRCVFYGPVYIGGVSWPNAAGLMKIFDFNCQQIERRFTALVERRLGVRFR